MAMRASVPIFSIFGTWPTSVSARQILCTAELEHCRGPGLARGVKGTPKEIAIPGLRCCRSFILREEEDE